MNDYYAFSKYVYFSRWISYWHQINEVLKLDPQSVLIVGVGDKIASDILKKYVPEVKNLDCDKKLDPDMVASVEKMSLPDGCFDVVLCAEVLEHLPFEKFETSLTELKRVSKKHVVLSLPHFGPPIKFSFKLPLFEERKFAFKPFLFTKHQFNGKHYWEIGKRNYPISKIKNIIKKYFKIKNEFIPFENQYHHFFVLEKYNGNKPD